MEVIAVVQLDRLFNQHKYSDRKDSLKSVSKQVSLLQNSHTVSQQEQA
jgi:hypothetical protein